MSQDAKNNTRKILTHQFGELTIEQKHIFHFPEGLLGFEDILEFILINEEETVPFRWLISIEDPSIGFPLLSPWHIVANYRLSKSFDIKQDVALVIITLENERGKMTANMKAPVIFDVKNQLAKQIILPSDKYSPNHVIPITENAKVDQ